jgi:hypothetical protein
MGATGHLGRADENGLPSGLVRLPLHPIFGPIRQLNRTQEIGLPIWSEDRDSPLLVLKVR